MYWKSFRYGAVKQSEGSAGATRVTAEIRDYNFLSFES
jgi:hypothetical protein